MSEFMLILRSRVSGIHAAQYSAWRDEAWYTTRRLCFTLYFETGQSELCWADSTKVAHFFTCFSVPRFGLPFLKIEGLTSLRLPKPLLILSERVFFKMAAIMGIKISKCTNNVVE